MDIERELQEIINLIKEGNRNRARELLRIFIKANPTSEQGWWIYARIAKNIDERIFCLEKVTSINPNNVKAQEQLLKDKNQQSGSSKNSYSTNEPNSKKGNWFLYSIIGVGVVIGIILGGSILFSRIPDQQETTQNTISDIVAANPSTTQTITPTNTSIPTAIPTKIPLDAYCNNFYTFISDLDPFLNSLNEMISFLETETGFNPDQSYTWNEQLANTIIAGKIASQYWRESTDPIAINGFNTIVNISRDIEEKGIKLEILLSREQTPSAIEISHQKINTCLSEGTNFAASIANLLENDQEFSSLPDLSSCSRLDIYTEELINYCSE